MSVVTVRLVGVGGQGTILAADVLAKVALAAGLDVRLAEVHGMAQRGGSVETTVRFGEEVHAPVVDAGSCDHLIAFELIEAARAAHHVRQGGTIIAAVRQVDPLPVLIGAVMPPEGLEARLAARGAVLIDAEAIACEVGSPRSANIVLLGAASYRLPFDVASWHEVIASRVPAKTVEANLEAFDRGRAACAKGVCEV